MEIFQGLVRRQNESFNGIFYIIEDVSYGESYRLPQNQVYFDLKIGDTYDFIKNYNRYLDKTFISVIHSDFKIDTENSYIIKEKVTDDNKEFFILKSEFTVPLKVEAFTYQTNLSEVKCRVINYKRGKPVLRNIDFCDCGYEKGQVIEFSISGYRITKNRRDEEIELMILEDGLEVKTYNWYKENRWCFSDIKCEVIDFTWNGNPKLRIIDDRHPLYERGGCYEFEVCNFKDGNRHDTGQKLKLIELIDELGCKYSVKAFPNQENKLTQGDKIKCIVKGIDTRVLLTQAEVLDPYFSSFEEIIGGDSSLKAKYFTPFLNEEKSYDNIEERLKEQYNSKAAFWVFTYCNQILPKIFYEKIEQKDYTAAEEVNNLMIIIEGWILAFGILDAFAEPNAHKRKETKFRVQRVLETSQSIKKVLPFIKNIEQDKFLTSFTKSDDFSLRELYYFFKFSPIEFINTEKFLDVLIERIELDKTSQKYYISKLADIIQIKKKVFIQGNSKNYFHNSEYSKIDTEKGNIGKYTDWSYCQYTIYDKLEDLKKKSLLLARILRLRVQSTNGYAEKKKLLFNAYHCLSKKGGIIFLKTKEITLSDDNPNIKSLDTTKWIELEKVLHSKDFVLVKIIAKVDGGYGYNIEYDGILGFLPIRNVSCRDLRNHSFKEVAWELNVKIVLLNQEFGLFIAKQLDIEDENFLSNNLNKYTLPEIGTIIEGRVKSITEYGIFISTRYGDALIHKSNISDDFWYKSDMLECFQEGELIYAKLMNIDDQNRLEYSFKELINTEFEDFYHEKLYGLNILSEIDSQFNQEEEKLAKLTELEKGFIIEQFAILQESIDEKIKNIRLAKQFFSSVNNARSFLLNIYTAYFESLKDLDRVIQDYSFEKYNQFSDKINLIKKRIRAKTLEEFPESENLILFVEILSAFNDTSKESITRLYELVKDSDGSKPLVDVLSKTALANNLLISETAILEEEENLNFSLKNLKRIRNYIKDGVFSLAESTEDRMQKELEEKRNYWLKKIQQDEGMNLEFKSTFITPIPSEEKKKDLYKYQKQLCKAPNENAKKAIKKKITEEENKLLGNLGQKIVLHSALRAIAGFANTKGGCLLLGVSDDKKIFGLERDYETRNHPNDRDEFGKFFDDKLKEYFGKSFSSSQLKKEFLKFPQGDILIVEVVPSPVEVFLLKDKNGKQCEELYVRNLASTEPLEGKELAKFIKQKHVESLQNNYTII